MWSSACSPGPRCNARCSGWRSWGWILAWCIAGADAGSDVRGHSHSGHRPDSHAGSVTYGAGQYRSDSIFNAPTLNPVVDSPREGAHRAVGPQGQHRQGRAARCMPPISQLRHVAPLLGLTWPTQLCPGSRAERRASDDSPSGLG
ncbi:hypothetical protein NDU88_006002 [Pleurodeles waltl]|uniref:Secreted protein n=1 Tax=Pleurodeles waltl TaxID=8319 RepID=A0AAV7TCX3_PLEWA|nr:hypothetical protein NDU88_006002 [Pleurodeles waltl]